MVSLGNKKHPIIYNNLCLRMIDFKLENFETLYWMNENSYQIGKKYWVNTYYFLINKKIIFIQN